ncbi:prolactin-2A1-like [Nannospalax galili]|uniref:prolactin-2A1-like n=1 Tax=Nannospalax galili TaxID=1026970 RepID=UPI0004ED5FE4|nr:prolactin-2A1-like [Nannospalax galili]
MLLSLSQPCAGTLLLLLVTNVLLGKNTASDPVCYMWSNRCHLSFSDHFSQAVTVSQEIRDQVTDTFTEFDKQYTQDLEFNDRVPTCHTSSLAVPEKEEEAQQMKPVILLKLTHTLLGAWTNPLQHLVEEMGSLQGAPAALLSNATEIEENHKGLLEGVRKLIRRVEDKENKNYPAWSGLESLQSDNEDTRLFAFYNLFRCLIKDSETATTHLKHLRCQMDPYSEC